MNILCEKNEMIFSLSHVKRFIYINKNWVLNMTFKLADRKSFSYKKSQTYKSKIYIRMFQIIIKNKKNNILTLY